MQLRDSPLTRAYGHRVGAACSMDMPFFAGSEA